MLQRQSLPEKPPPHLAPLRPKDSSNKTIHIHAPLNHAKTRHGVDHATVAAAQVSFIAIQIHHGRRLVHQWHHGPQNRPRTNLRGSQ